MGRALHGMLFLENPMRTLFVFNGLRSYHSRPALLGYHYRVQESHAPVLLSRDCHAALGLFRHLRRHVQEHLTRKDVEIPADPPPPYDALRINEEE